MLFKSVTDNCVFKFAKLKSNHAKIIFLTLEQFLIKNNEKVLTI